MPILLYSYEEIGKDRIYNQLREIKLAGKNLFYHFWEKNNKPKNSGWHISAKEISELTKNENKNTKIIFNLIPNRENANGLGLYQVEDFYLYTYYDNIEEQVTWTIVMPKMTELDSDEYNKLMELEQRINLMKSFKNPIIESTNIYEFLYMQGDDKSWNWGRVGSVNAALLYPDSMRYFLSKINI